MVNPKLSDSGGVKKEIKDGILITTLPSVPIPRYYIQPEEHSYFWLDKEFKTGKHDLRDYGMKKIFVNILDKKERYFHVKMFLKDGQTQEAFLPTYFYDMIQVHNMDLLFDGRFNI